jgi:carbon starvation protein
MNILLPVVAAMAVFWLALRVYPGWIARVYREDDRNPPPSVTNADGRDFVESRTHVAFAQHFAAIAGAGPIVGPTLALAFGWQPVWLWIVIGGIFFGAVHDMTVLFTSLVMTVGAFFVMNWAQRHTTAVRAAIIYALEPPAAAVFSNLVTGEVLPPLGIAGGALILLGIVVAEVGGALQSRRRAA